MLMLCTLLLFSEPAQLVWEVNLYELDEPVDGFTGMTVVPDGRVFFLDREAGHIYSLSPNGEPQGYFSRKGQGPGELRNGAYIQYDADRKQLLITDPGKSAFIPFSLDGTPGDAIKLLGDSPQSAPISIGGDRILYGKINEDFRLNTNQGAEVFIEHLVTGMKTSLIKLDASEHGDFAGVDQGEFLGYYQFFWVPRKLIAYAPGGKRIFVGSTRTLAFRVFDSVTGKQLGWIKDATIPTYPLTDHIVDRELGALGYKRTQLKSSVPDQLPVLEDALCDSLGRLWVRLDATRFGKAFYRIYHSDGDLAGQLVLDSSWKVFYADESNLWGRRWDRETEDLYIFKAAYKLLKM